MRTLTPIATGAALALLASAAFSAPRPATDAPKPSPAQALSAEQFAQPTSYRTAAGHGYDARARHIADCLATYPGYDPHADRVLVRPGLTKRCNL